MIAYTKLLHSEPYDCPNALMQAITRCLAFVPANVPTSTVLVTTQETRTIGTAWSMRQHVSLLRSNDFNNNVQYEMVIR